MDENNYQIKREIIAEGLEFERNGQLDDAYRCYSDAADSGNPAAMFMIGNMYLHKKYRGKEVPVLKPVMMPWEKQTQIVPDMSAAFSWFMRSAQSGFPDAMSNVGTMLYFGYGVDKNPEESKEWLIRAAASGSQYGTKALKDLFGIDYSEATTDEEYDLMLDQFCEAVETHDPYAGELYRKLMLGNDRQLCRLGYRLAVGRYHKDDLYREYDYPQKSNGRSCAPVTGIRIGWTTLLIVNRDAFPEKEPVISFSMEGYPEQCITVRNIVSDTMIAYEAEKEWGWFPRSVRARCFRLTDCDEPGEHIDRALMFANITLDTLFEKLCPREDEALFFETGEKEYSVEICHIRDGKAFSLLRYTVGGRQQGDIVTAIPQYRKDDPSPR